MLTIKSTNDYGTNLGDFNRLYDNSWGGAIQTLDDIINADKETEFMEYLEEIFGYENEAEDTEVNDFIWFDREVIYDNLGLDEDGKSINESEVEKNDIK
jgi:hypothetical protein